MISREEFDAEMVERDRRLNEWRASTNADLDDMRRVLAETRIIVQANEDLIRRNAGSLIGLWQEYLGHISDQHGGQV